ncbi:MAG: Xaa-Pro peptidase family protein [Desulfuromonadales bacterium]|jgi:Xaa-Pro dipeptidase|nr:Xaa-Pro peptidase family protein [Desulfuromonadales bacterium]
MRITPATELTQRCQALQAQMVEAGLEATVILQNSDLFYFSGSIQQGVLYVPVSGEPVYLVRKDYGRARMESGLKEVAPLGSMRDLPGILGDFGLPKATRIGMELDVVPVALFHRWQKVFPGCDLVDASHLIRTVRAIKSEYEIAIMKDCALIMDKIFQHAREVIAVGRTDLEVAADLECFARKEGHQGIMRFRAFNAELYFGHIFSGPDAAVPAFLDAPLGGLGLNPSVGQGASYKRIERNEPIIIDVMTAYDGYMVDQTRTMVVGKLPQPLEQAYYDMLRVQERLFEVARPGAIWGEVYQQCYDLAVELGYKDHFMGASGSQVSFIGHGVGLEVDEYPFIARGFMTQELQENMTFAFEPKAVYPGLGVVGVENTYRIAGDHLKRLTYTPEDIVEL